MPDDREMVIRLKQVRHEDELSHWEATMEFDGEQVYMETGVDLRDAGDRIYSHVWEEDTVIPKPWRDESLPWEDLEGINFDVPPSLD